MTEHSPHDRMAAVVLHWGDPQLTQRCVDSLQAQEPSVPILVVANDDRWTPAPRNTAEVIVNARNLGYTGGMNVGLRWAIDRGFEFVTLVTNDGWFTEPGALLRMADDLAADGRIAACGPGLLRRGPDGRLAPISVGSGPYPRQVRNPASSRPPGLPRELVGAAWLEGSCLALRISAVDDVGYLDELLFMYFDEIDWCYRAQIRGWYLCRDDRVEFCEEASASATTVDGLKEYYLTRNGLVIAQRYLGLAKLARNTFRSMRRCAGLARRRDPRWRWTGVGILDFYRGRLGMNRKLYRPAGFKAGSTTP